MWYLSDTSRKTHITQLQYISLSIDYSHRNCKEDQSNNFVDSLKNFIELLMAWITQSESALNKISVFTLTVEKQATKEHDDVSLHALLDVFE